VLDPLTFKVPANFTSTDGTVRRLHRRCTAYLQIGLELPFRLYMIITHVQMYVFCSVHVLSSYRTGRVSTSHETRLAKSCRHSRKDPALE